MRKQTVCIYKNKDADQRLCFGYMDSKIPLPPKSKLLATVCACTARFVLDLFVNYIVGFLMMWSTFLSSEICILFERHLVGINDSSLLLHLSYNTRKQVFRVSDQVRQKMTNSVTEER